MGKKKQNKGKGAEKTALKAEKKADKKTKKQLREIGEDDVEALIAEFQEKDRRLVEVYEEKCSVPSQRCNLTMTAHPDKDILIFFGGEYFNGHKTFMYNDLFFYNTRSKEWTRVQCPNAPAPRCAHQAVAMHQGGGQLWIFGGEFASPTQSQFYHYKDLWMLDLREKKWQRINAPGGPSARSGHRMATCKKQLIVFGGFHDNTRDYKYFNDCHIFDMEFYTWMKIQFSGNAPSPRSGCVMAALQDSSGVAIYGGYSKEKKKGDVDQGKTHRDMFLLKPDTKAAKKEKSEGSAGDMAWKWHSVKQTGVRPSPRCGSTLAASTANKAFLFGGVFDEEDDETVEGIFYDEMYSLEMDKGIWHEIFLRGKKSEKEKKKRRKIKEKISKTEDTEGATALQSSSEDEEDDDDDEDMEEEVDEEEEEVIEEMEELDVKDTIEDVIVDASEGCVGVENEEKPQEAPENSAGTNIASGDAEDIFKVTVSAESQSGDVITQSSSRRTNRYNQFTPSPRMNCLMSVSQGVLYLYGGIYEDGDRQVTLSDFYSLDLHKLDKWDILIKNDKEKQVWVDSDSSNDEKSDEEDSEEDMDTEDAPCVEDSESYEEYFTRTVEYWQNKVKQVASEESFKVTEKQMVKAAKKMSQVFYKSQEKSS